MASVVDTLRIYERLRKTDLSEGAAKEITEIVRDVVEGQFALLATKEDVLAIREDTKRIVAEVREDTKRIVAEVREDTKRIVAEVKAEIIKWVAGMLVAQAAIVATLVKLL